jgi:hypothetical protein
VVCVWEAKDEMAVEEFQTFIDGPDGPGEGVFKNTVHKAMPGATLPRAHFTVQHRINKIPIKPGCMVRARRRVGPEVGPTPALCSCVPEGTH